MRTHPRYSPASSRWLLTLPAAMLLAACGGGDSTDGAANDSSTSRTPEPQSSSSAPSESPSDASPEKTELVRAGRLAKAEVPRSTVTSIDGERNGSVWEVELVTRDGVEHTVRISATDGSVVAGPRSDTDDTDDNAERQAELAAVKLNYRAAAKRMVRDVPSGRLVELTLDNDDGRVVWEGDLTTADGPRRVVKIDASSGKVISNRGGDDDRDDDDD